MNESELDNPFWHALTTDHLRFAISTSNVGRYPADMALFAGLKQNSANAL
jgi:hypothetical protein